MAVLVPTWLALISHLVIVRALTIRLGDQDVGQGENHWIAWDENLNACINRIVFNEGQVLTLQSDPSPCNVPFTLEGSTYQFGDCDEYEHPASIYDGGGNHLGTCSGGEAGQESCSSAPIYWISSCTVSDPVASVASSTLQSSTTQPSTTQPPATQTQQVSTTLSSSTMTTSTMASSSTTTSSSTTGDQESATTPTSTPAASSGYSREEKIGLGIGIGFGIPMFLLASVSLCMQCRKRH